MKKIITIFLSLILCFGVFVTPVAAAFEDYTVSSSTHLAIDLEWDKEAYQPGETATLNVYWLAGSEYDIFGGYAVVALDGTYLDEAISSAAPTIVGSELFDSYFTASSTWATSATIESKVEAQSTDAEKAMFNKYLRLTLKKNAEGTHDNSLISTAGLPSAEINELGANTPMYSVQFTISADAPATGVALNAGMPSGMASVTNYHKMTYCYNNKTTNTATQDVTPGAVATATIGESCADDAHVWDNGVETTAPTCGEAGVKTYTCSVCKHTKTEEISATGNHTAADAVKENEVAASCSVAGSYESVVYCSVCDAEISRTTVEVPATGDHVYATETDRKEATCTEDGYVVMACGCGDIETTPISATGHTEEEIPAVDATCTTDGATAGVKCSVCDEVITAPTTVPSAGHTAAEAVKENEVAATCTADGSYESVVYCSVCDAEVSRETVTVSATGHSYGEGKQVKSPTCTKAGETKYTCETCGYVDKRAEPAALGHVEEVIPGKAPTCIDPGYKDAIKCSVCNSYVVAPEKVDALGHTKDEGIVTPPTYSSQGYTTYNCTVCGVEFKDDIVGMLPIDFAVAIQEPSITEIRCKDTIVLHAVTTTGEELPDDVTVVWTADNENFKTNEIDDGKALEITSKNKGNTVFTVTVYDVNGTVLSSDTVEMYSNAGFFAKIGGFFRTIFGLTKYYEA